MNDLTPIPADPAPAPVIDHGSYRVLRVMIDHMDAGGVFKASPSDIAHSLDIDVATASRAIDELLRDGLISPVARDVWRFQARETPEPVDARKPPAPPPPPTMPTAPWDEPKPEPVPDRQTEGDLTRTLARALIGRSLNKSDNPEKILAAARDYLGDGMTLKERVCLFHLMRCAPRPTPGAEWNYGKGY